MNWKFVTYYSITVAIIKEMKTSDDRNGKRVN